MGTPGQDIITAGLIANPDDVKFNRAGIPVTGTPPEISRCLPPDTQSGVVAINTPYMVDLVVSKRDRTNFKIKYQAQS